jgi:ribosomal protein L37AE/L43A
MTPLRQPRACDNMNHRRANSPVSHCPQCGHVVNAGIHAQECSESKHAAARRKQATFCVDCGSQLIFA